MEMMVGRKIMKVTWKRAQSHERSTWVLYLYTKTTDKQRNHLEQNAIQNIVTKALSPNANYDVFRKPTE